MKKSFILIGFFLTTLFTSGQNIISTEKLPELVIKGNGNVNMILIPCMSCRWNEWEEFMERNKEKYKMYAITVPGYGGTSIPNLTINSKKTPFRNYVLEGLSDLIDQNNLQEVTVVGHSWGTMVAVQLAAKRPDIVKRVISVDGAIESTSWTANTIEEKIKQADNFIKEWTPKLQNAEEWSKFNGASVGITLGKKDSVSNETMLTRIKLLTSFMATDRKALLQYWRENHIIDLTHDLQKLDIPILDIQSFVGKNQKNQKNQHLESLKLAKAPQKVKSVFMYDTKHFIMYHRPLKLDCIIENFMSDRKLVDFAPSTSDYFEEEAMN